MLTYFKPVLIVQFMKETEILAARVRTVFQTAVVEMREVGELD